MTEQSSSTATAWWWGTHFIFVCRIVERGYYSERDAAHVIKQILEAVAVRLLQVSMCENPSLSGSRSSLFVRSFVIASTSKTSFTSSSNTNSVKWEFSLYNVKHKYLSIIRIKTCCVFSHWVRWVSHWFSFFSVEMVLESGVNAQHLGPWNCWVSFVFVLRCFDSN